MCEKKRGLFGSVLESSRSDSTLCLASERLLSCVKPEWRDGKTPVPDRDPGKQEAGAPEGQVYCFYNLLLRELVS